MPRRFIARRVQYQETFQSDAAWVARAGSLTWHDGGWTLGGDPVGEAHFRAYPLNRVGGSVRIDLRFTVADLADPARFRLAVNVFRLQANEAALDVTAREVADSLTFSDGRATLRLQHTRQTIDWRPEPGRAHQLTFIQVHRAVLNDRPG